MPKRSTHPEHEEDVEAEEEQGIKKKLSPEERRIAMDEGDIDEEPYDKEGLEALRDDDELGDWEEGFMEGATGKGSKTNCAHCGRPLPSKAKLVEKMIDGEIEFFCSSKCATNGLKN